MRLKRRRSATGIPRRDSAPSSTPIRPKRRRVPRSTSRKISKPSFSGRGEGQVRTSSTQDVARQLLKPISGMIATSFTSALEHEIPGPRRCIPGKLRDENPTDTRHLPRRSPIAHRVFSRVISTRARSTRYSNSLRVNFRRFTARIRSFHGTSHTLQYWLAENPFLRGTLLATVQPDLARNLHPRILEQTVGLRGRSQRDTRAPQRRYGTHRPWRRNRPDRRDEPQCGLCAPFRAPTHPGWPESPP